MASPLEQFTIVPIIDIEVADIDISFTNSSLWMAITAAVLVIFMVVSTQRRALVPGRLQASVEYFYQIIADMVRDNVGSQGRPYFPFIFSLFMFILFGNLLGLIPGAFTFTSHLAVTFAMAAFIFVGVTIIGLVTHGFKFFSLFFPHGAPIVSAPVLIPIEIISYFSRPISLSVRLFANMTVGHVLLKVIGGGVVALGGFWVLPGLLPLAFLIAITLLEVMIAVIQAYVFAILTCVYLNDALHLH
ncbi:MAG: F0F1 ATP synthase subunit A [Rhodospirillaceae bacterium]|nr:F0F1 ATP synthase subunit A [Rhodospirillaceae bacterium]MBT3808373.1 F0F1 ATP synthase subunit A [Rhodospirillaceae bacterium]MBT3930590.1 F0F1 ATP synthase subunit A [Rhodospirillaceae bacterium]MBT4772925.1 F0F1 ATP synthase subunit A [Rhodospirillaceae bacterium]MBT5358290.1 F0F1 ATP synthase subunit A [Rhodospirillaceae bacterium]